MKKHRSEDAAIAYTWYHYFYHQDQPEYVLRLPMTKVIDGLLMKSQTHGKKLKLTPPPHTHMHTHTHTNTLYI